MSKIEALRLPTMEVERENGYITRISIGDQRLPLDHVMKVATTLTSDGYDEVTITFVANLSIREVTP